MTGRTIGGVAAGPLIIGLLVAAAFTGAWYVMDARERQVLRFKTELTADRLAQQIERYVADRLALSRSLRDALDSGRITRAEFVEDADALIGAFDGLLALNWIDASGTIRWVVPEGPNADAIGRDLTAHPKAGPVLERARETDRLSVTPIIALYQGGSGFATYLPVHDATRALVGYINSVFRVDALLESMLSTRPPVGFAYRIRSGADTVFEANDFRVPEGAPYLERRVVPVGDTVWQVEVEPGAPTFEASRTIIDEGILALGLIAAVGMTAMLVRERRQRETLRQSEERLRALAENVPGVFYSYDRAPDGDRQLVYLGPGLERLLGPDTAARVHADVNRIMEILHPDDRARVAALAPQASDRREMLDLELRLRADDGAYRWVRSLGRAVTAPSSTVRWHVVLIDIAEQKRDQRRRSLMMDELDHRVKNNLAAIISLCDQTLAASPSPEAFRRAFRGRLHALARSHESLARRRWEGVDLAELVNVTLEPYRRDAPRRVTADGPDCLLPAPVASPLGLAVHELATNAAKYGALSDPAGRLSVRWERTPDGTVTVDWVEHDGPAIDGDPESGFGLRLVRGLVEREIGGAVRIEFESTGLRCRLVLPGIADPMPSPDGDRTGTGAAGATT